MIHSRLALAIIFGAFLSGCGSDGPGDRERSRQAAAEQRQNIPEQFRVESRDTIWDLLDTPDAETSTQVNKYLWRASLDALDFLPLESADPFSGTLVFGWGRAPGSSREYRATVLVTDPALNARSLRVAIHSRSGAVSPETAKQVEDAILTRARQLWQDDPAR